MATTIEKLINKVPMGKEITKIQEINKGFSQDEKWKIEVRNGKQYFIRVADISHAEHKRVAFDYMKTFKELGVPVPEPISALKLHEEAKYIEITEFMEGLDGEEILPTLSPKEQYEVGRKAGEALKMVHSIQLKDVEETWDSYRIKKYDHYLKEYEKLEIKYFNLEATRRYIDKHLHLLKKRPVRFLHDDFHPANLMIHSKKLHAILDFDRYEWGDPVHDFHKIALFTRNISAPFAIGQIHGYFKGNPSILFWQLYTTYVAMVFVSDIVWSVKNTPNSLDKMITRLHTVLDDHEHFTKDIPNWYKDDFQYLI